MTAFSTLEKPVSASVPSSLFVPGYAVLDFSEPDKHSAGRSDDELLSDIRVSISKCSLGMLGFRPSVQSKSVRSLPGLVNYVLLVRLTVVYSRRALPEYRLKETVVNYDAVELNYVAQ